ncbi:hypothetical protein V1505DRAFT_136015 [Lipomyces doorenjongii]
MGMDLPLLLIILMGRCQGVLVYLSNCIYSVLSLHHVIGFKLYVFTHNTLTKWLWFFLHDGVLYGLYFLLVNG